jgi:hypothetical protein
MPRSLKSVNAPSQQLHNFTNRTNELATLQRLLDLPEGSPLPVVMFWGVGGNGKSWLLRRLRELLPPELPAALRKAGCSKPGGSKPGGRNRSSP